MNRRITRMDEIFPVNPVTPSISSTISDVYSADSQNPLTRPTDKNVFIKNSSFQDPLQSPRSLNMRRWSQSLSAKGGKGTLPSRFNRAISVDGHILSNRVGTEEEITELTYEFERHDYLMEDTLESEQKRIETLKEMPQSLTVKRQIKTKLQRTVDSNSKVKSIGFRKRLKYRIGMWFNRRKISIKNTISNLELWYGSLKTIEGHFGSGVAAYFKFLRWLFILNLLLITMAFGFVTLPQILFNSVDSVQLDEHVSKLNQSRAVNINEHTFSVWDIFTGEGYFTSSILFYGAYVNETFSIPPSTTTYSLPFAYFMTMLCLYVATFIIISTSMARSYRKSFIEASGSLSNVYSHKIFCAWDFGIANEKAADLKHNSIYTELRESINDLYKEEIEKSKMRKFWDFAAQATAHILVFALLAGLGVGMWYMLQEFAETKYNTPWTALYLSVSVNVMMLVLQGFFSWMATMEDYKSPRTALHVNLLRNFCLEIVVVSVMLGFWLTKTNSGCWETSIGQEIYRLVIIDFVISIIGAAVIQSIRFMIFRKYPKIGRPQFNISKGSLGLVFNQTLLWVGLLFSPVLAIVVTIKMVITFYLKKTTLIYYCEPPSKLWRSAQTQTLYLVLVFLSLLGVVTAHAYIITQIEISGECGPFRGSAYMYQILVDGILELREENMVWRILMLITRPAVMGGLLLAMCVIIYYLRAKSKSRIAMVSILKDMLYLEAKDKEHLRALTDKETNGKDWLIDDEINYRNSVSYGDSSSAWLDGKFDRPSTSGLQDQNIRNRRY